jgi:hypothetical protein
MRSDPTGGHAELRPLGRHGVVLSSGIGTDRQLEGHQRAYLDFKRTQTAGSTCATRLSCPDRSPGSSSKGREATFWLCTELRHDCFVATRIDYTEYPLSDIKAVFNLLLLRPIVTNRCQSLSRALNIDLINVACIASCQAIVSGTRRSMRRILLLSGNKDHLPRNT